MVKTRLNKTQKLNTETTNLMLFAHNTNKQKVKCKLEAQNDNSESRKGA